MTTRLTKLRVSKVALVDLGANPGAEVLLFKRGNPQSTRKRLLSEVNVALYTLVQERFGDNTWMDDVDIDGLWLVYCQDGDYYKVGFTQSATGYALDGTPSPVERQTSYQAKRGNPTSDAEPVYDSPQVREKAGEPQTTEVRMADDTTEVDPQIAELTGQVATLTAERDTALATIAASTEAGSTGGDTIDKSALPEAVRKRLDDADALEARVAKMESDQRIERFTKQARDEYAYLGAAEDLGPALEEIDRLAPKAAKTMTQLLKGMAARADLADIIGELGSGGDGTGDPQAQAQSLIEAEVAKGATIIEATRKVFAENPQLAPKVKNVVE